MGKFSFVRLSEKGVGGKKNVGGKILTQKLESRKNKGVGGQKSVGGNILTLKNLRRKKIRA